MLPLHLLCLVTVLLAGCAVEDSHLAH